MWADGRIQAELKEQNVVAAKMHNRFYFSPIYSFTTEAYYFECDRCCTDAVWIQRVQIVTKERMEKQVTKYMMVDKR